MSKTIRLLTAIAFALLALESTLSAGPASVKPPKSTKPQTMRPAKTITAVKPIKPAKTTTAVKPIKPAKTTTAVKPIKAAKTTTAVKPVKPAKATTKLEKSTAKADAKAAKHAPSSSTTTTPTTGPGAPTVVTSHPIADKIAKNPNLAAKLQAKLPAGTTLAQASTGFKNQGQFIAAVNVSNNLGIDFTKLQAAMTGQTTTVDPVTHEIVSTPTGVAPLSLGQSIQKLRPGVDADAATVKATDQTSVMLQTTTASTTSTKTKSKKSGH
jgi:hypothetical protein